MLKGVGAVMGLPLLEAMRPFTTVGGDSGRISPGTSPVRLGVLYMPNGVNPHHWTPKGVGRDFELSPILEPLARFKNDLLVFTELWNAAANTGDGHYVKTGGFLTGTTITRTTGSELRSGATSLDQVIARQVGNLTPLPSLELGIEPPATGVDVNVGYTQLYGAHISWSTPTTPLAKELNPRSVFDRLFRSRDRSDPAAAANDRSVIDLVLEDAKRLHRKLGQPDQLKLNEYLDSVRAVEKRIEFDAKRQRNEVMSDPLARQAIKELGERITAYDDPARVSERAGNHTEHVRLMLDLMVLGFWTDSTRVSTFMFGNAVSGRNFSFLGGGIGGHHQTSHHENDKAKLEQYQRINQWHLEQYAYLLDRMQSFKEGDRTLLENSMVLLGAGMRDGNAHNPRNLPILLAGRAGGTLSTGRHLVYEKNTPLCNLYQSILRRAGAPVEKFGDSTGELPGLEDPSFAGSGKAES